ncbi:hypothetical protein [Streptomyces tanashiensis]|uniref:hypothetical protein n=1 Tax=Streptomyces tanashiensis TaxID=67367 RepID=UPI0033F5FE4E
MRAAPHDLRIPYTAYLLSSSHLRHYGWTAVLAPPAAFLTVLAAVVLADFTPRRCVRNTAPQHIP